MCQEKETCLWTGKSDLANKNGAGLCVCGR